MPRKEPAPLPDVKVGQIWEDMDKRMAEIFDMKLNKTIPQPPRQLEVLEFLPDDKVRLKQLKTGRETIIARRRMKPGSTGFKLIRDVD